MYLDPTIAKILFDLGFPEGQLLPANVYATRGYYEWIVGGQVIPQIKPIIPKQVIDRGTWLLRDVDLLNWLEQNTDYINITHDIDNGFSVFYITAIVQDQKISIAELHALSFALYELIIKILLFKKKRKFTENAVKRLKKSYGVSHRTPYDN